MPPTVIAWDYQFAPNAQKTRNYLHATGIPYKQCDQPFVKPRPILENLGVTYRRVPVLSVGKDVYCDNQAILRGLQATFKDKALPTSRTDYAYETLGYRSFWMALPLVPSSLITKDLAKDRAALFSVFSRPDFPDLRQNSLAEFKTLLTTVENDILSDGGPFIAGKQCTMADIHAIWIIKWALETLQVSKDPGVGPKDFPKVYKWIESLPAHDDDNRGEQVSAETATDMIMKAEYAAPDIGVDSTDPVGLAAGDKVAVETTDDVDGAKDPQRGKLVGLSRYETVLELDNSLRVHFPRIGYAVKKV